MANVFDVAAYILAQRGEMTTWKLQKLVYYSQAWSLVWDDAPLFQEPIQAWANGPVCPALYAHHAGRFTIADMPMGRAERLTGEQIATINTVLDHYDKYDAHYLSELTHQEEPWKAARKGLNPGQRGNHVIPLDSMAEYYGGA